MIKSILDLSREEVENLGKIGFTHKSTLHYDVCKALKEGMNQGDIAINFKIDDSTVRKIKSLKCPDCGHSVNQFR